MVVIFSLMKEQIAVGSTYYQRFITMRQYTSKVGKYHMHKTGKIQAPNTSYPLTSSAKIGPLASSSRRGKATSTVNIVSAKIPAIDASLTVLEFFAVLNRWAKAAPTAKSTPK